MIKVQLGFRQVTQFSEGSVRVPYGLSDSSVRVPSGAHQGSIRVQGWFSELSHGVVSVQRGFGDGSVKSHARFSGDSIRI